MQLNEETCPVPESVLGQLYRASPHGLDALIEMVPAQTRAMLAVYCYRRAIWPRSASPSRRAVRKTIWRNMAAISAPTCS